MFADLMRDVDLDNFALIVCDTHNLKYINDKSISINDCAADKDICQSSIDIRYFCATDTSGPKTTIMSVTHTKGI